MTQPAQPPPQRQLTHNSVCPYHGNHPIKYCPDARAENGGKRGTIQALQKINERKYEAAKADVKAAMEKRAAEEAAKAEPAPPAEAPSQ